MSRLSPQELAVDALIAKGAQHRFLTGRDVLEAFSELEGDGERTKAIHRRYSLEVLEEYVEKKRRSNAPGKANESD